MAAILRRFGRAIGRGRRAAAVPVRAGADGDLELLLVRTRTGAGWTFPKGGRERGETLAEAAAREAVEEAGAAGRIVGKALAQYRYRGDVVTAFLLVVESDGLGAEPGRDPTWLGLEAARSRLAEGRDGAFGAQMEHVLREAQRAAGRVL